MPPNPKRDPNSKRLFERLDEFLSIKGILDDIPKRHLTKALLVFIITLLYIANSHLYDRTEKRLNTIQTEVEALKVEYTLLKAEYMFDSKRSELAKKLQPYKIDIPDHPPFIIEE